MRRHHSVRLERLGRTAALMFDESHPALKFGGIGLAPQHDFGPILIQGARHAYADPLVIVVEVYFDCQGLGRHWIRRSQRGLEIRRIGAKNPQWSMNRRCQR